MEIKSKCAQITPINESELINKEKQTSSDRDFSMQRENKSKTLFPPE